MQTFARAAPPLGGERGWPAFVWLAGLLEGEGTFLRPVPSGPRSPIISCRMTDLDVIEFVAAAFGTSVQAADKGPHKTEYAAAIRGSRCARLMTLLRPMLGRRRRAAIDRALAGYEPPNRKLSFAKAEQIRDRHWNGDKVSSLARRYGVERQTIHRVLDSRIYPAADEFPWVPLSVAMRSGTAAGTGLSWAELYWLAGWLEGEGSFVRPPPSSPKQVRIHASSCDEDVIREVGRLIGREPRRNRSASRRNETWAPIWRVLLNGGRAATLMVALKPIMSARRKRQIEGATPGSDGSWGRAGLAREFLTPLYPRGGNPRGVPVTKWTRGESNPCPQW